MSKQEATLENVYSPIGHRDVRKDNAFGLNRIDHFALPTRNIALMERFIRELLGGEPYYYAGFDEVDRKMGRSHHIFIRVGDVLMQCTETDDGSMIIRKDLLVRSRDDYAAIEAIDATGCRPTAVPQGSGTWLGTTLKFTVNEARAARPGNAAMLGRLTELMFVEILREYMQRLPADQGGWLAGLNDPHVGKALRVMHANPAHDWTVDELAREAAVSRSVLAQRFTDLVGDTPIRYLANWRMQLAKQMMRDGARNIQDVATSVGYESEAAFNRAFKRVTGSPPAAWRKGAVSG